MVNIILKLKLQVSFREAKISVLQLHFEQLRTFIFLQSPLRLGSQRTFKKI